MTPDQNSQALLAELPPTWLHKKNFSAQYLCLPPCLLARRRKKSNTHRLLPQRKSRRPKRAKLWWWEESPFISFFEDQCNFDNCWSLFYSGNAELCKLKELKGSKKALMIAPKATRHGLIDWYFFKLSPSWAMIYGLPIHRRKKEKDDEEESNWTESWSHKVQRQQLGYLADRSKDWYLAFL